MNVVQRNGVHISVEEERDVNHGKHVAHALGTDRVGQNLDGVADKEARPGRVVEGVIQEDHSDDGATIACLL
jgi:hypothetical protein